MPPDAMPRASHRWPHWLEVQSEPGQRTNDKSSVGQLVFQRWVIPDSASDPEHLAIPLNLAPESFRPVEGLAGLRQHFEPTAVFDLVLSHDPVPQGLPVAAHASWWWWRRSRV